MLARRYQHLNVQEQNKLKKDKSVSKISKFPVNIIDPYHILCNVTIYYIYIVINVQFSIKAIWNTSYFIFFFPFEN